MNPITNTGICSIFLIFREASLVIPIEIKMGNFKTFVLYISYGGFFFFLVCPQNRQITHVKLATVVS